MNSELKDFKIIVKLKFLGEFIQKKIYQLNFSSPQDADLQNEMEIYIWQFHFIHNFTNYYAGEHLMLWGGVIMLYVINIQPNGL